MLFDICALNRHSICALSVCFGNPSVTIFNNIKKIQSVFFCLTMLALNEKVNCVVLFESLNKSIKQTSNNCI